MPGRSVCSRPARLFYGVILPDVIAFYRVQVGSRVSGRRPILRFGLILYIMPYDMR